MNKDDLLYSSKSEKEATERVLALVRVKSITEELNLLKNEITGYVAKIDDILEKNELVARYSNQLKEGLNPVKLDADLENIDFRVQEIIVDLIKRINTRINLIKNQEELILELKKNYQFDEKNILTDIKKAKLRINDFT